MNAFRVSFLILISILLNLMFISFYSNNYSYNSCGNYVLCNIYAQSNRTRDDFPEREEGNQFEEAPRADFPDREQTDEQDSKERADFPDRDHDEQKTDHKKEQKKDKDREQGGSQGEVLGQGGSQGGSQGGGCLIATAAFGSELSPQVQFLRNFRDNRILSTVSGSSFMTVFNSWYYSFSPSVADYERGQPWLKGMVRIAIYPLLGILQVSEKSYSLLPGEYGTVVSGLTASSLIGLIYFTPFALCERRLRTNRKSDFKAFVVIIVTVSIALLAALLTNNSVALMVTTSLFVIIFCAISSILGARMTTTLSNKLKMLIKNDKPT